MSFDKDVIVSNPVSSEQSTVIQVGLDTAILPAPVPPAPAAPPAPNLAWGKAAGKPESSAPLARLPDGLDLDNGVDEPIHYDAARRLLQYRGFMCHGSYIYLRNLSADLDFLRALDLLYVRSADHTPARRGRVPWLAVGGALLALVALGAALFRFLPH